MVENMILELACELWVPVTQWKIVQSHNFWQAYLMIAPPHHYPYLMIAPPPHHYPLGQAYLMIAPPPITTP